MLLRLSFGVLDALIPIYLGIVGMIPGGGL